MSDVVIFLGPSLPVAVARAVLDAEYRPPAGFGDLYRAAAQRPRPRAIGLVDGVFQSVPSVRHKEILWAMAEGIHMFGAASLGALRAAELHGFGMVGIGHIFADYRDFRLEDDDEVAVDHGPAELGHRPLCEPMVNIRATLEAAQAAGVIAAATAAGLITLGKETFYKQRSYETLLHAARRAGIATVELDALRDWLPRGRIDRKRDDALAMLRAIGAFMATDPTPLRVAYHFESSEIWEREQAAAEAVSPPDRPSEQAVLDEVRLVPGKYAQLRREALLLALSLREARRQNLSNDTATRRETEQRWRRRQGLTEERRYQRWLADNRLDDAGRLALFERQTASASIADMAEPLIERHLLDALRLSGGYAAAAERAHRKQALAATSAGDNSVIGVTPAVLVEWYFSRRLHRPPTGDIEAFAREMGFADAAALTAALRAEYLLYSAEDSRRPADAPDDGW